MWKIGNSQSNGTSHTAVQQFSDKIPWGRAVFYSYVHNVKYIFISTDNFLFWKTY